MRKKIMLYILVLSILIIGIIGLSGCGGEGKSAYEIWLELGNVGTEQDFIDSLKVQGEEGSKWLYGKGEPAEYLGKNGDLYLDLESCNVYAKEGNEWIFQVCIKGEKQTVS